MPRVPKRKRIERIWHPWYLWECYPAGFYGPPLVSRNGEEEYAEFLANRERFGSAAHRVITRWKYSCEQHLSNESLNRIAWIGQSSVCLSRRVPSCHRGGFSLLSQAEQLEANLVALHYLNLWLVKYGASKVFLR